jgi:hypothetical protein
VTWKRVWKRYDSSRGCRDLSLNAKCTMAQHWGAAQSAQRRHAFSSVGSVHMTLKPQAVISYSGTKTKLV